VEHVVGEDVTARAFFSACLAADARMLRIFDSYQKRIPPNFLRGLAYQAFNFFCRRCGEFSEMEFFWDSFHLSRQSRGTGRSIVIQKVQYFLGQRKRGEVVEEIAIPLFRPAHRSPLACQRRQLVSPKLPWREARAPSLRPADTRRDERVLAEVERRLETGGWGYRHRRGACSRKSNQT
jgi:hypothetical protein